MEILFHTCLIKQLLLICLIITGTFPEVCSQDYFQQEVNYKIQVTLNDRCHELNAFETIEYINNSPDTLRFLFFHLWPNGYSDNNTPLARQIFTFKGKERLFSNPALKGYIDSLDFKVNEEQVQWNLLPGQPDICKIWLNKNLKPGDSLKITTPFHVKIPQGETSRLGHIGESYQISQWYPKPAVYDRSGWHQMSYLELGEFYSEFGSFDISITLPANYIVGATGDLQTEQEAEWLDKLASDTARKSTLVKGCADFPPSSEQSKTLRYTEKQVHDFAWFADKRFQVLKGKVKLPDSGREVTTWAMFINEQAGLWKTVIQYENNALTYFSKWNGDYPYHSFTVVQTAMSEVDGMEYPGIAAIGQAKGAYFLDEVIAHEAGHNWFYSALGSDERRYPFMDEGVTSAYEMRYMNERYPGKKLWEIYLKNKKLANFFHIDKMPVQRMRELDWLVLARKNLEQPVNLSSTDYNYLNYSLITYTKAAMGFTYLRAYLGDSVFDSTMHDYYQKWKFKHPQPDDLRCIFEFHTGKDLSWFFNDFLCTLKRIDYKIINLKKQQLLVKNNGELASPLVICGIKGDSIYFEKRVDGFEGEQWIDIPSGNYSEIKIDPNHVMPELFRLNNSIRRTGVFRRTNHIRTQLLFTIENPEIPTVMYIPAVNWNKEDGFMVGLTLHNGFLVVKPVDYFIMPFYSMKNSSLTGFGKISYNITPFDCFIRMATITLEGTKFGAPDNQNYYRAKAGLDLYFRTYKINHPLRHNAFVYYIKASDLYEIESLEKAKMNDYLQIGYRLEKTGLINPFSLLTLFEYNESFQKTSVELNYKFSYYGRNNGLDIRLFSGIILKNTSKESFYAFSAGGRNGRELYLYQGFYPDRFSKFPKTFWSRQMSIIEGGLVSAVNDSLGYSNRLLSVTLASSLPGKAGRMPVKPFASFLLNDHGFASSHHFSLFYEAGIKAGIWNFFEIHVPLLVSKNIELINGSLKNRIRFIFNLNSFNQIKLRTKLL